MSFSLALTSWEYYSRKFVRQFLRVNFAYANSHVRKDIDKTFMRKKNRKLVCKYTHGLSCCTIEIFRKCRRIIELTLFGFKTESLVYSSYAKSQKLRTTEIFA